MEDLVLQLGCALGVLLVGSFHVCFVLSHDGDEYGVMLYQGRGKERAPKKEKRPGSAVGRATRRWLGGYEKGAVVDGVQCMKPPRWGDMRKAVLAAWPGLGLALCPLRRVALPPRQLRRRCLCVGLRPPRLSRSIHRPHRH